MKNKLGNCSGFTIVELLVTLSLTSLFMITVLSFFLNHLHSYHEATENIGIQNQAKAVMNLVIEQAMETKGLTALSLSGDNPYLVNLAKTDGTQLVLSYNQTESQLKWGINEATNIIPGKITDFSIDPKKRDGTPVDIYHLTQANMATVRITVSGTDTGLPETPEVTLENSLRFRNYSP